MGEGNKKTSWIVITGGVLSGLGKGVAAASIGNLLSTHHKVIPIKCDGYLNVDPGTMNPLEHGEVFVLDDGGEVDMDFGHYERFLGVVAKKKWNLTMGKVYEQIRIRERHGDYLGKTVQLIPHVTDFIKNWWREILLEENADVGLIEIGGTIGDIENELYVEAARQLRSDGENVTYIHLTYIPLLANVNEQKSKPTQQSIALLRARGIQPDIILARSSSPLDSSMKEKIATMCGLSKDHIIPALDVSSVYEVPIRFHEEGLSTQLSRFGLQPHLQHDWRNFVLKLHQSNNAITIAICGKYTALEDSYASVIEAIKHASAHQDTKVKITWLETSQDTDLSLALKGINGVIVPGGFGGRGVEGKIAVVRYCKENNIPFLGICYGLQMAVIEHARSLGLDANSTEVDPKSKDPVVTILEGQEAITNKGATMRLGAYPAILQKGSIIHDLYNDAQASERHRHRYEVNPKYREQLAKNGLVFSGMSPDGTLVEFLEREDHPYFVATQAHPELKSSLTKPAPLFVGLITAARRHHARS